MYYHKPDKIYNDDGQVNLLSNPGINFILYGMRKMANRGWQAPSNRPVGPHQMV